MSASGSQDRSEVMAAKPHKLFITGLDGKSQLSDIQAEIRKVFSKYGEIISVVPKKSYNQSYCYAFVDFKDDIDASTAIKKQNNTLIGNAKITVTIQDSSRRKKGATEGCYKCGKHGHFARDCRSAVDKNNQRSSSRQRSRSERKKKKKRRHSSDYSRSRSQSQRKKQKKKRSKSRGKKHSKSKKSKKDRQRSYSNSD